MKALFVLLCIFVSYGTSVAAADPKPDFQRVFLIVFENASVGEALAQPFFHKLANEGAFFSDFHAVGHPSYPNYLALISGSTWGIHTDSLHKLDHTHLGDLLEAKHKTWRVYSEGYPGNCYLDAKAGKYAGRHVPFLSFKNIQEDPKRCAHIVEASQLPSDVKSGSLADFSLFIPNNDNNGHDTNVTRADQWFSRAFGPLLGDRRFTDGLLFIVTFDEDDYSSFHNTIYTVFWGNSVQPGPVNTRYNHYSTLRTIEDAFELGTLNRYDERAQHVQGMWHTARMTP